MQKSVRKILYIHSFAADFWGGSFGEVVCVFEVFVIAFCFGEFVGVFVFAFGGDRERVMKRWVFYSFCCFFSLGFLGGACFDGLHKSPGDEWRSCCSDLLKSFSVQLTENLVQSKQAAKDLTQPNNSVVFFFFFFFFWECLECFGRQNNTKELQLWKRQNQSTQTISLINPSSSSSFPQI